MLNQNLKKSIWDMKSGPPSRQIDKFYLGINSGRGTWITLVVSHTDYTMGKVFKNAFNSPESFFTVPNPREKMSWPRRQPCIVGMVAGSVS